MQVFLLLHQLNEYSDNYPMLMVWQYNFVLRGIGCWGEVVVVIDDLMIQTVEAYSLVILITTCYSLVDGYHCLSGT
jgi:hypothetical protein